MTPASGKADGGAELLREALTQAFRLGESHWQHADSEFQSDHRKAAEIRAKFRKLCDDTITAHLATAAANGPGEAGVYDVGRLVTLTQEEYPGLGQWFVQLRDGDEVIARVYGKDHEQIRHRIAKLNVATATPQPGMVTVPSQDALDAKRYRWLNSQEHFMLYVHHSFDNKDLEGNRTYRLKCGDCLDSWIDARIAAALRSGGRDKP